MPSLEQFIALLVVLAPGYIVLTVVRKLNPDRKQGDLHVAVWSIVYGLVLYCILSLVHPGKVPSIGSMVGGNGGGHTVVPSNRYILELFSSGFLLGTLLARFQKSRIYAVCWACLGGPFSTVPNEWTRFLSQDALFSWVIVELKDGRSYLGAVTTFDSGVDDAVDWHLTLSEPSFWQERTESWEDLEEVHSMLLPRSEIAVIQSVEKHTSGNVSS